MISQIGGTRPGGPVQNVNGTNGPASQKPQAQQEPSAPGGDTVKIDEGGENDTQGAGSQNMDALLNGLNGNDEAAPTAAGETEAGAGMSHEQQVAYVEQEIQKTQDQLKKIDGEIQKIDSDIANYKTELSDIDGQVSEMQGGNEKGKNDQKIQELNQKKTQINQRIQELEKKKKELGNDKKKLEDYLKKLEETWQKLQGHCNSNKKIDMPQKPQTSSDKKNNEESEWQTKLEKDVEAVNQERAAKGAQVEGDNKNAAQDKLGNATPDNAVNEKNPVKDVLMGADGRKPAEAAPAGDAMDAAGKGDRKTGENNNADKVNDDQNATPAVMQLKNDWDMCIQEGAEDQVSTETKDEITAILGIADDGADGLEGKEQEL